MHPFTRGILCVLLLIVCAFGAARADDPKEKELLAQAKQLLGKNEVNKALQLAQEVLRLNPNNMLAYSIVGNCYYRQHRYDEAAAVYEKAVLVQPSMADAWGDLGFMRMYLYDYEGAELAFKKAVTLNPNRWEGYVFLAQTHYAQGDVQAAKQDLEKATALAPPNRQRSEAVASLLARVEAELALLLKMKERATAHFIFRFPPELPPLLVDALCSEAEKVYEKIGGRFNDYPSAKPVVLLLTKRKQLAQLVGTQWTVPGATVPLGNRILLTFVLGEDGARDVLGWLWKEYAAFVVARLSYGACSQWFNEALSSAIEHEKATPTSVMRLAYMRRWLQEGKKLPDTAEINALFESITVERKPPPTDKVYPQVVNGAAIVIGEYLIEKAGCPRLRQALREIGNGGEVKQALSSALGMSWEEFEAAWQKRAQERYGSPKLTAEQHYAFARTYAHDEDFGAALREIRQAIALEPTGGKYRALLALLYWVTGQKETALAMCEEALQRGINDPAGYHHIGSVYLDAEQLDKALAIVERALKEGQADSRVYSQAALIYLEKNKPEAALPLAEKAVTLDPGDGLSQALLFKAYVQSGLPDKAIALGEQLLALNPNVEAEVYYLLGIAYRDKGDKERAKGMLEKALTLGYEKAKETLEMLKK